MPWFKVDDKLHSHPKRYRAGLRAMGAWVIAGSWSSDHLTDGHVPAHMLDALGIRKADADALVKAGLWHVDGDGWRFHDWQALNPSRSAVEQRRAEDRQRKAEAREARKAQLRVVSGGTS